MNPIEAMQAEIEYQVQDLYGLDLSSSSSSSSSSASTNNNSLFAGSGDSYIAGLAAQYFSNSHAICCYPMDIIKNPSLIKGRNLYIVSISGNTQSNILAAKIAKKHGTSTITALTARSSSRLARSCDQTIELRYRNTGIVTAGTISFTASMIKCISLLSRLVMHPDLLRKLYNRAEKQAEQVMSKLDNKTTNFAIGTSSGNSISSSNNNSSNNSGNYFLLGDGQLYAIARYGTLKFNEVFGARALAYPAEEFCHSPLFSLKETDQVIVLGDSNGKSRKLSKRLSEEGFSSIHVEFEKTGIELLLQATFFMQLFVVKLAQKYSLTTCHFLMNKKLLKMSSDFIYP